MDTSSTTFLAGSTFLMLLIPASILAYVYWYNTRKHMYQLAEKIPGPNGLPVVGMGLHFAGASPHEIFKIAYEYSRIYKNITKAWAGPFLIVFIHDPRDAEIILSSSDHLEKSSEYRFFKPWLGNGILISSGHTWKTHRKIIAPAFHLNVLKSFIDLFNANSRVTVAKLQKEAGKTFDCHDYMAEATVDILLETAMGVSKTTHEKGGYEYAMAVMKMCDIIHMRHTKPWLHPTFLFRLSTYSNVQKKMLDLIHSLTNRVVKSKIEAFNKGIRGSVAELPMDIIHQSDQNQNTVEKTVVEGISFGQSAGLKDDLDVDDDVGEKRRLAFLEHLIETNQNGGPITEDEIREQVTTILFEGHDTTAAASSFFLSIMGAHPDIQEKVIQELNEIFGGTDRPATFADTLEMKYLERCLLETIRLYPPVPIIARRLNKDVKMASGDYTIPAGATVGIATFAIHRRGDIYPNPDKFDPDNFLPEHTANRHYYGFIPFSAGPRSCIGRKYAILKLKILLSTILRNYRVKSELKESDFQLQGDIILKQSGGFNISLEPREKGNKNSKVG